MDSGAEGKEPLASLWDSDASDREPDSRSLPVGSATEVHKRSYYSMEPTTTSVDGPLTKKILVSNTESEPTGLRFQAALSSAWDRVPKKSSMQMIWESNPFLASVFGVSTGSTLPGFPSGVRFSTIPPLPYNHESAALSAKESLRKNLALSDSLVFARVVKQFTDVPWPVSEEANRSKALARWKMIIDMAPGQFQVGRLILADLATGSDPISQADVVADVFAHKATRTIMSRSGAFLLFINYCKSHDLFPFPIDEATVYRYVRYLRLAGSAPTKAASFKSSLAFCMGVLGLDGVKTVLESARVYGAVFDQLLSKRPLKQRRALLADEVYRLEMICRTAVDVRDAVFAGFVLFLVFGRTRNYDCSAVRRIIWDFYGDEDGFVQIDTTKTKTSRTTAKRTTFLPQVAPRLGLSDAPWADAWRKARGDAGLEISQFSDADFPLMPAPLLTGGWSDRPLSSSETRKWLAELLAIDGDDVELETLGSHSGKVTGLSWMAKVGADPKVRAHLGYHTQSDDISMLTYSRDAASEPLRQFCKMLKLIRIGEFHPDRTRSGYMSESLRAVGFNLWVEGAVQDGLLASPLGHQESESHPETGVILEASDSDSSSSDESADADHAADGILPANRPLRGLQQEELDKGNLYFHNTFCTVHCVSEFDAARMRCGRQLRSSYSKVLQLSFDWPKCMVCFKP